MKHLRLLLLCLATTISSFVYSDNTLEIYLNNGMTLTGIDEVERLGITIHYYYLDDVLKIEQRMSKRATDQLKNEIDAIVEEVGIKQLIAMSDSDRNQLLLKQMKSSHIDLQDIRHSLVSPEDREAIKQAQEILRYAFDQGVTSDMLPALIYKGRLLKNTHDITAIFKTHEYQK